MISVILATRQRVENVKRLWQSLVKNTRGRVELVFAVDKDDASMAETVEKIRSSSCQEIQVKVLSGYRDYVPLRINEAVSSCTGSVIALWGDDLVVHTEDWNGLMERAFEQWPDNIGVAYCRDDRHNEELCAHPFVGRRWVETVGYAAYSKFFHYYVDTWLHDMAKRIGRLKYVPEVFIQHLHCDRKKAALDEVYVNNFPYYMKDDETFKSDVDKRVADAKKLQQALSC